MIYLDVDRGIQMICPTCLTEASRIVKGQCAFCYQKQCQKNKRLGVIQEEISINQE